MPPSRFVHFGDVVKFYPISIYLQYRIKMPTCGELREKLASLGLATSGTKAVLEARLHAANVAVTHKATRDAQQEEKMKKIQSRSRLKARILIQHGMVTCCCKDLRCSTDLIEHVT